MKKNTVTYFLSIMCVCFVLKVDLMAQNKGMFLSEADISQLLKSLESKEHGKGNWHINYNEQLNDTTYLLNVFRNDHTPNEGLGLCDILNFEEDYVFTYKLGCKVAVSKEFKNGKKNSPFFIPDSQYWYILVIKRKNNTNFYEVQDLHPPDHRALKGLKEWDLH